MKKHGRVCGSRCLGPMTFHPEVKGQLVSICQGAHLAMRDISCFKHGLVFLSRPVKIKERISICIESTVPSWDGALRVGFTNHCPNANLIPPMAIPDLRETPGYCAVPVPEETCQTGAHVEFWMNHAGYVMIQGADGKTFYMKVKGQVKLKEPLYVFLDMYGSTSAVRLLGSRKGTRTSCPDSPKDLEQFSSSETKVKEQGQMKSFFNFNKNVHSDNRRSSREASTWETSLSPSSPGTPVPFMQTPDQTQNRRPSTSKDLNRNHQPSMEEMDVTSLLREFQQQYLSLSLVHVVICRKTLLKSAIDTLSNSNFTWTKTPLIEFVGESALDHGGPRREFFRLLMIEVQSSLGVFEGKPGNLFFTYDQSALQQHKYEKAGKLVAWSLVHGGPGLKALDPCLYQLMCGQEIQLTDFDWRLIPDGDVQEKVKKILSCRKTAHIHELQRELGDWICECGFPGIYGPNLSVQDIPNIYSFVVRHYIYLRVSNMINQFIKGLNSYGRLWDKVKENWIEFLPVFINMKEPMSRHAFMAHFQINWSRDGTKKREEEEQTVYYWEQVLKMIEDKKTELHFEDLLVFITATDEVPALGFSPKPSINFYQPEGRGCRLPYASTCMMGLFLPRGVKCQAELNTILLRAVRDSAGFGKT
uniref:G2/M phase-specific E3 ubiquitin-protein ligase-like n=1 Tax=Astyanax mexicanus TaxID=7994 RepID=A0A3B1KH66_ASTMX